MVDKNEILALKEYLRENKENELRIARSFLEDVASSFEQLEQYRAIGTVEQFRESTENQTPKKPVKYGTTRQGLDNSGNSKSKQEDCYECPTCESFLGYVSDCKDENYQDDYCRNCGQALEWGN